MNFGKLHVSCVVSQMFEENCYLLWQQGQQECIVIDPGLDPNKICEEIERQSLSPVAILNTHGHSDHIAGNEMLKRRWPDAPLVIGAGDANKLLDPLQNLSAMFGQSIISPAADETVREGDLLDFAGIRLEVFETPGHSAGHVAFLWKTDDPWVMIGGDVLFSGSIGRTDFPDGNLDQLVRSIVDKFFSLPDTTVVLSGHGPETTIGQERVSNMVNQFLS